MCDPVTTIGGIAIAGGVGAGGGSLIGGLIEDHKTRKQNESMEDALEAQYQQEVQLANEQFIIEQEQLTAQTMDELEDSAAESRDQQAEVRRQKAGAEAVMAGIGVSGGTSLRTLGAFEVMEANVLDEGDLTKERIQKQYYADEDTSQYNRIKKIQAADNNRMSQWNPAPEGDWLGIASNTAGSTIKGLSGGLSIGNGLSKMGIIG